jgi:hypothetical protein
MTQKGAGQGLQVQVRTAQAQDAMVLNLSVGTAMYRCEGEQGE